MPARSKKQQMAAGAALAAKRGERSKQSLKGASREMVESMSERQLREFARTKRKGLPRKHRGGMRGWMRRAAYAALSPRVRPRRAPPLEHRLHRHRRA